MLQHVSGYLKCNAAYEESFWGCYNFVSFDTIWTVITDADRNPLFPVTSYSSSNRDLKIKGYNHISDELILNAPNIPYQGRVGQSLKIWYAEDLLDMYDGNNLGKHCVNVYAMY
jgi:hypothetical protein